MDPAPIDETPRPADAEPTPEPAAATAAPAGRRLPIGEDWLATLLGLGLVALVLLGVVTKAMIP